MARIVRLGEKTAFIDVNEWPVAGGCNLFLLTDRQTCIVQSLVFPFVRWETRFVSPIGGKLFEVASDVLHAELVAEADALETQLWGDCMDCSELVTALAALANAIANQPRGGGAAGSGCSNTVADCIGAYDPADMLPPAGAEEPDPEGDPPEGFETWELYYTHKCRAAHVIWQLVRNTASAITMFNSPITHVAAVATIVGALVVLMPAAFTPPGIAMMIAAFIAFNVISYFAAEKCAQLTAYMDDNKQDIVCAMYASGSAAGALDALANVIEDAIQTIEWGTILGPLAPELNAALGSIFANIQNNGTVNALFEVTTDIALPDVSCDCGDQMGEWHYDVDAQGWAWWADDRNNVYAEAAWNGSPSPADPNDSSPGCLRVILDLPDEGGYLWYGGYWRKAGSSLPSAVAHTGDQFKAHGYKSSSDNNVKVQVCILYTDQSYDFVDYAVQDWQSMQVGVGAPNDGKTIAYLLLVGTPASTERNSVTWYFDHASWEPA